MQHRHLARKTCPKSWMPGQEYLALLPTIFLAHCAVVGLDLGACMVSIQLCYMVLPSTGRRSSASMLCAVALQLSTSSQGITELHSTCLAEISHASGARDDGGSLHSRHSEPSWYRRHSPNHCHHSFSSACASLLALGTACNHFGMHIMPERTHVPQLHKLGYMRQLVPRSGCRY